MHYTVYVIKKDDTTIQQLTDAQILDLLNQGGIKIIRPDTDQLPLPISVAMDDGSTIPDLAWQDILVVDKQVAKSEQPAA